MRLRELIRERGLKQTWVAENIGISEERLSMILAGKRTLPLEALRPLATVLDVPVETVLLALEQQAPSSTSIPQGAKSDKITHEDVGLLLDPPV
jgi:transcriptional regulator with XRE-family HTH domain